MSLLGKGIFKGMAVTLKNFALSYVDRGKKERLPTVQYPEEGNTVTPFSRNFPFLIYDGEDEIDGIVESSCDPKHADGSWIRKLDMVESRDGTRIMVLEQKTNSLTPLILPPSEETFLIAGVDFSLIA